jgi:hypothetical protein
MKKFFKILVSGSNEVSSKRVMTLFGFIMLCIGFIVTLFWDYDIPEHIYSSMGTIVEVGMGTILAERFASKKSKSSDDTDEKV